MQRSEAVRGRRIAALVATPNKQNTGMRFVNDALVLWLESLGLAKSTDFFQFENSDAEPPARSGAAMRCILDLAPERYEQIVIWGDFLLDRDWLRRVCTRVASERRIVPAQAVEHAERVIFGGAGDGETPSRIVVGQCFLVGNPAYEADAAYRERFARLAASARFFRMRDPLSAARAAAFSGLASAATIGLDAALLRPALCEPSAETERERQCDGFGVFFGRTPGGLPAKLASVLAARATKAAGRGESLAWFPQREPLRWLDVAIGNGARSLPEPLDEIVARLRRFHFVLTDTYHLALVCWSIGVPALCLGRGAQRFAHPVHDKKKELFFLSQRLERFHFFAEDGFGATYARVRTAVDEILGAKPGPDAASQIRAQANELLGALGAALAGRD